MAEEQKRPSVAEILAAARKQKEEAASARAGQSPSEEKPAKASAAKPGAAKPAGAKLSVQEMLAAARAQKSGGAESTEATIPAVPKPAAEKPIKAPGEKAVKPAAAVTAPVERDTGSILASARSNKLGPVSKSEAGSLVREPKEVVAAAKAKLAAPPMPAKPDYAKPKPKVVATEERRGFMSLLLGSAFAIGNTSLAITTGLFTLGTARFMFPNVLTEPPSRFKVGFPSNFAPGQVETKFVAQFGVWVVNSEYAGQKQIYALQTVCTHLGCTPNWLEGEQKFKCPCHGSGFYKDGINFEGPAPRPLERFAISLGDDGQIEIDKSRKFQEELGQWADPASFVLV